MARKNSFSDSFKYLHDAAKDIKLLSKKITAVLNTELPARVLSRSNIFNMTVDLSRDLTNIMLLHIEDALVEQNINIANKPLSVRGLATLAGHQATRAISATGVIKFTANNNTFAQTNVVNLYDATFKCEENGASYVAVNATMQCTATSPMYIDVIEGEWVTQRFYATGEKLEILNLDDSKAIENHNITVFVNGTRYKQFDSLYDMKSTDAGYIVKNGISNQVDIIFGNSVHGMQLVDGDEVVVTYLVTSGELGNIANISDAKFTLSSGAYDQSGNEINVNDTVLLQAVSGFNLGSYGEDVELTRTIAGYNSRALVFVRPENLKAFLSRLSIITHVNCYTDVDSNVFKVLMLPNLQQVLKTNRDYLYNNTELTLSNEKLESIREYINTSGSQMTTTEIQFVQPSFKKYAVFVYITGDNIIDTETLKASVENALATTFLNETYFNTINDKLITVNELTNAVYDIDGVNQCALDIFSEENELARINGEYDAVETRIVGAVKRNVLVNKKVHPNENPSLGFDELSGIDTSNPINIPILRGGFMKYDADGSHMLLEQPIYIFLKNAEGDFTLI